jgi:RNA polymerase sigma factor (sigma-70 family)
MSAESFIPTRASLLERLKDWEDQASWQEFAGTYGRLIRSTALKAGLSETEADDAVQETFLAVARNIKEFKYDPTRCSFKSWLLLITRQRIIWQWRMRAPQADAPRRTPDDATRTATIDRIPDETGFNLDAHWDAEWEKHLMAAALERVKRRVDAKQFQMFDLYALQGWPVADVARTLRVNSARVYLAKHRVARLLKREVKRLEQPVPG